MGLGREIEETRPLRVENLPEQNEDSVESDASDFQTTNLTDTLQSQAEKNKLKREERRVRRLLEDFSLDGIRPKRNAGYRKTRRYFHTTELIDSVDKDDICLDFSDMVPHSASPFGKLLTDKESMKIWIEFVERDEKEQRLLLLKKTKNEITPVHSNSKDFVAISAKDLQTDLRQLHPASYSLLKPKDCYDRIDSNSKKLLFNRMYYWKFIDQLEGELRCFFVSDPAGTFVSIFESRIQRSLCHAVAQYLNLSSKSCTEPESGQRITEFTNVQSELIYPTMKLVPYMQKMRARR